MANWHYYNKNGERVGPISVTALRTLVQQGLVTRETVIENHTGRTVIAGEVRGLTFPESEATLEPSTPPVLSDKKDLLGLTRMSKFSNISSPKGPILTLRTVLATPRLILHLEGMKRMRRSLSTLKVCDNVVLLKI